MGCSETSPPWPGRAAASTPGRSWISSGFAAPQAHQGATLQGFEARAPEWTRSAPIPTPSHDGLRHGAGRLRDEVADEGPVPRATGAWIRRVIGSNQVGRDRPGTGGRRDPCLDSTRSPPACGRGAVRSTSERTYPSPVRRPPADLRRSSAGARHTWARLRGHRIIQISGPPAPRCLSRLPAERSRFSPPGPVRGEVRAETGTPRRPPRDSMEDPRARRPRPMATPSSGRRDQPDNHASRCAATNASSFSSGYER